MNARIIILVICAIAVSAMVWFLAGQFPHALGSDVEKAGLVRALAIMALVGAGLIMSPRLKLKGALKYMAIWGLAGVAILTAYSFRQEFQFIGTRIGSELLPSHAIETGQGEITIRRGADGHFHLNADVNGTSIRFLVDTGASVVTLSRNDAERIGFRIADLEFTQQFQTANGTAWGAQVRLDQMTAGPIIVKDVRTAILDSEIGSSLLGLSFLDKLSEVSVQGDTMTLRQ